MTVAETEMVLELLRAEYPHSFEKLTTEERSTKVKTWASMFSGDDSAEVLKAIRRFMENDTKGFAPTYGQIRQHMNPTKLPAGDDLARAHLNNLKKVYKAVTGMDYEPSDCVKEKHGFPKCEGCNEETKCRPAKEKGDA